ncbi:MAG: YraN family protein [Tissierellales bacterium]|nr:YraN family protein [Tissierellales bacterium]
MNKKVIGNNGEKIVADYLTANGYKIMAMNYKNKVGEIDIIAVIDSILVFVEVKTRNYNSYGSPSEAVDRKKQSKIIKTSLLYLQMKNINELQVRYDVAEVYPLENNRIVYIENAFNAW